MFQQTVNKDIGVGIPGELAFDGPLRVTPGTIDPAATAANCVLGRYFTRNRDTGLYGPGGDTAGNVDLQFGGIAGNPKELINYGTAAGGPLAPSLLVKPGSLASFTEMGMVWVSVAAPAQISDKVIYTIATGVIATVPAETAVPALSLAVPNAVVYRIGTDLAGGDVICIKLTN